MEKRNNQIIPTWIPSKFHDEIHSYPHPKPEKVTWADYIRANRKMNNWFASACSC